MSTLATLKAKSANGNAAGRVRGWLSPLNLHWAGVGLLVAVNLYLLAQMGLLWHSASTRDADARAQQQIELKTAEIAAMPLRGLDTKLADSTAQADRFYRERLPGSDSAMLAELGALTKKAGVRLTGAQYVAATVLPNSAGELTELKIDARLSGDYRPLVMFLNSLERDRMFFVINAVTLTGQQTGMVNLRLRLTTYMRKTAASELAAADAEAGGASAGAGATAQGGPGR